MSEKDRKAAIKLKNQRYYRANKGKWAGSPDFKCGVYTLTGFPDGAMYVGVTANPGKRSREHQKRFCGTDISFNLRMTFDAELPVCDLNVFENFVIVHSGGAAKCLNKNNTAPVSAASARPVVERALPHMDAEGAALLTACFEAEPTWAPLLELLAPAP